MQTESKSPLEHYKKALKRGKKTLKARTRQGLNPYLPSLDEVAGVDPASLGQRSLGLYDVPITLVCGTKAHGRRHSFAADFMPLLEPDTEFAAKWVRLFGQLEEEGLRDPLECYEHRGLLYAAEGNKRMSVMRYNGAVTVPAQVTRLVIPLSDGADDAWYRDFLASFEKTGLYQVRFARPGQFPKLQAALGVETDHVWTDEQRRGFTAGFTRFKRAYDRSVPRKGGFPTPMDALLVWLLYHPFAQLRDMTDERLLRSVRELLVGLGVVQDTEERRARAAGREGGAESS